MGHPFDTVKVNILFDNRPSDDYYFDGDDTDDDVDNNIHDIYNASLNERRPII